MAIANLGHNLSYGAFFETEWDSDTLDTTGANLIVIAVSSEDDSDPVVTSNKSGTVQNGTRYYTFVSNSRQFFYIANPGVGTGHVFHISNVVVGIAWISWWSGADTTAPFDQENGSTNGADGQSTTQPGTVTPTTDGQLVLAMATAGPFGQYDNDFGAGTVSSPFTFLDTKNGESFVNYPIGGAYEIQTTATARNPTFTPPNTGYLSSAAATFKAAAAASGGGIPVPQNPMKTLLRRRQLKRTWNRRNHIYVPDYVLAA